LIIRDIILMEAVQYTKIPENTTPRTDLFVSVTDVIAACGEPILHTTYPQRFDATLIEEDFFLAGGGWYKFHQRLLFPIGKLCRIAYVDQEGKLVGTF
jgi:hypothetical protein